MSQRRDSLPRPLMFGMARSVNGWGARCGCGGRSIIHIPREGRLLGLFLCADCIEEMASFHMEETHRDQPDYWPGDEERDESYVDPRKQT